LQRPERQQFSQRRQHREQIGIREHTATRADIPARANRSVSDKTDQPVPPFRDKRRDLRERCSHASSIEQTFDQFKSRPGRVERWAGRASGEYSGVSDSNGSAPLCGCAGQQQQLFSAATPAAATVQRCLCGCAGQQQQRFSAAVRRALVRLVVYFGDGAFFFTDSMPLIAAALLS
jgi:hypothetical protein